MAVHPLDAGRSAAAAIERAASDVTPESVRRALSTEGTGRYKLGAGGRDPSAPSPLDANGECDCSGALCFWWGEPRKDSADGEDEITGDWIYTTSLFLDAKGPRRFVREVPIAEAQPGDALVYRGGLPTQRIGHCSIIIARAVVVQRCADVAVLECQSSTRPAIRRSSGALWDRRNGIAIRRSG